MTGFGLLLLSAGAFVVSAFGAFAWRRLAERREIVDVPNERSLHSTPMPRGGGCSIPLIVVAAILISTGTEGRWELTSVIGLSASVILIAAVSFWDDLRRVSTPVKLATQIGAALLALTAVGHTSAMSASVLGSVPIGLVAVPIGIFWMVGLTNAFNFMDGIDGIASLQTAVAGLGWVLLGLLTGIPLFGALGAALCGASLGFLTQNWPPARVFMGDVGSASLGFAFAVLSVLAARESLQLFIAGGVLVWPFLFDTSLTIYRRWRRGERLWTAHRTHLYQRLVLAGFTHRVVALGYALLALVGIASAVLIVVGRAMMLGLALGLIALSAIILCRIVRGVETSTRAAPPGTAQPSAAPARAAR